MRRLTIVAAIVSIPLVGAACGGGSPTATTETSATADPGKAAVQALLVAAATGDERAMWNVLSAASRRRLGPTFAAFKGRSALELERELAPLAGVPGHPPEPFVSERISQRFGLIAIARGDKVLATPVRLEGGAWKVETPGPVKIQILSPQPGSRGTVAQIGVEVHANGGAGNAVIVVDGRTYVSKIAASSKNATVYTNLPGALPAGPHVAVAYAELGGDATALAWTFDTT